MNTVNKRSTKLDSDADPSSGSDPVVQIQQLRRYYTMGQIQVRALDGVTFSINAGDLVIITGNSGSGKSTLLHLLALLDQPIDGAIYINGQNVSQHPDIELSRLRNQYIGMIFQQFNLIGGLTVVDNIALPLAYQGVPLKIRRAEARKWATRLGLASRIHHLPAELSGGQMQRVAIARALITRPVLILADEPTGNLDSVTSDEIMTILFDLHAQGHTLVIVTHDPKMANAGTRHIEIQDGRVIGDKPGIRSRITRTGHEQFPGYRQLDSGKDSHPETLQSVVKSSSKLGAVDLMRMGLREGLLTHKLRTLLTMLGVIIGVFSVIAMSSFSLGSRQKQANQIRALGSNLIRIRDVRLETERLADARIKGSIGLSRGDLNLLEMYVRGIKNKVMLREIPMNIQYHGLRIKGQIFGIQGNYLQVNNLKLSSGRFIDDDDIKGHRRVVVIGGSLAEDKQIEPGDMIQLGSTFYTVVGILAEKHIELKNLNVMGLDDPNDDILIPLSSLLSRTVVLDSRSELDEIRIQMASETAMFQAVKIIDNILEVTHKGVKDYELIIPLALLRQKEQSRKLLNILTICIASISLIVGGIGIMNIMLASVKERTREIGIRRSIGASQQIILLQFLSESTIISLTGGWLGVALAMGIVWLVCPLLEMPVVFSWHFIGFSVIVSIACGLIFGIYPAHTAAKMEPVEALKYE